MVPREHELLRGMCDCYAACGEDFEHTVAMVARARDLTPEFVEATLHAMKNRYSSDQDYKELRSRLPSDFPM